MAVANRSPLGGCLGPLLALEVLSAVKGFEPELLTSLCCFTASSPSCGEDAGLVDSCGSTAPFELFLGLNTLCPVASVSAQLLVRARRPDTRTTKVFYSGLNRRLILPECALFVAELLLASGHNLLYRVGERPRLI